jgi:hypothetical protein
MAATAEVFAWNEASIYLFPAGGSSAVMAFGEDVQVNVAWGFLKFKNQQTGSFAARTNFTLADKDVTMSIGQLYYAADTFTQANSATAFNCKLVFSAAGGIRQTGEFGIWSAVFTDFSVQGQEGAIFRARVQMRAADISGV